MIKRYVARFYPGFIASKKTYEPTEIEDINKIDFKDAYAVRFYERTEFTTAEGERLLGKYKESSPVYYKDAKVMTLEEVKKWEGSNDILIQNMIRNNLNEIILTKCGQCLIPEKNYIILKESP